MALTITYDTPRAERISRNYGIVTGNITFDSSYPAEGESLDLTDRIRDVKVVQFENKAGYKFEYDATNDKVKVFTAAPAIVYEEAHTAVGNAVTLDYPAAWIINVCTAGQNEEMQAVGTTLADHQCALTAAIADGVRTGITTYGATDAIFVTYVTQAWVELYHCLVQEEAVTLASGANNVANKIMGFGYLYNATDGSMIPMDIDDGTEDQYIGVKFGYATGGLDANAANDGHVCKFTYLKEPASGWIHDRFVEKEDATNTTGVNVFDFPLLLWLQTGHVTIDTAAAGEVLIEAAGDPAAGEAHIIWGESPAGATAAAPATGFTVGVGEDKAATSAAYLKGHVSEIPGLVPLEAKNATDLSKLTGVKFIAYGLPR